MTDEPTQPESPAGETETEAPQESGSNEAARYRKKLREVEKERDDLTTQLDTFRRNELARLATTANDVDAPRLYDASDLFGADYDLAGVLTDDGLIDEAKVREVIAEATDNRSHLRADRAPRRPRPDPSQGARGGGPVGSDARWSDVLGSR